MSAWLVALALSAGYLVNKNLKMANRLDQTMVEYHEQELPADSAPDSSTIRKVQRAVPVGDSLQDLNLQDLSSEDVKSLSNERKRAAQDVVNYESPTVPEIQGVYLHYDRSEF